MKPRTLRKAGAVVAFVRRNLRRAPARNAPAAVFSVGAPHAPAPAALAVPRELWIGLHLPQIALEALRPPAGPAPVVAVELRERAQQIVAADSQAQRAGIRAGMSLAAALALVPELRTLPRSPRRERELLERLALRAQRFTPRVSLAAPDGLLLEVKGSLHLFGGARALQQALATECAAAGVHPALALAPTPLAALAGARAGRTFCVMEPAELVGHVAQLPLTVLRWPSEVVDRLRQMGVSTIGQALRLPRAGFARRFGVASLASLDRLTGRRPDLREHFRARERFRARCELTYEIEHQAGVLVALAPLFQDLGRFLRERQCGITRLECRLRHPRAPATSCVLTLAAPEADGQRLLALFGERLANPLLPEPVRACELRSGPLVPRAAQSASLWQPGEHGGGTSAESPAFLERLRARLGAQAVYGLRLFPEHRPESAWRVTELEPSSPDRGLIPPWPPFRRPLWLLPAPQLLLQGEEGLPRHRGPLRLIGEPERIETGWWDGGEITRDYYTAMDIRGVRMWIYRERTPPHRWFLHGIFG